MSLRREARSLTRLEMSSSLPLSVLSMALVSPMARSSVRRMPPLGACADSQPLRPLVDEGVKHSLWSPASAAVKVKRPEAGPRCETTRWSLSKTSCGGRGATLATATATTRWLG